ncbi:hypothetical protein OSC52_12050 [Clostridium pasteurianum]|uniref:hypothetical protein n=1 Tax=Clostridium pasteurianum TaxID=1501 RepID=UPI002260BC2E|nr:hypothetical protein [Clostridium pasteurianum]UZW12588.1 hypothetical protein OSC52_12050 [Clostridium pasteurianum]
MYNNLKSTIPEETKNNIKNKLLSTIIFKHKNLTKLEIKSLKQLNPEYITAYYTLYSKINTEVEARNNIAWIKRVYYFFKDELKFWRELKHEWTETYNKNLIRIRKELGLNGEEILNIDQISEEEYDNLMYLQERIDMSDINAGHIEDLFITLNNKLMECCKYIENISFNDFCSLIGINKITAFKNLKDDFDYTKNDHFPYYYSLLWWGIEDDREEEGWKSNRNGMPYFYLCTEAFLFELDKNKEAKKKVDDYLIYDMGLGSSMYTLDTNQNGEQTIKKYYPPLKAIK